MIKVNDYMSKPVITAKRTDTISDAVKKMDYYNIGCLVIVDGKKPVGIMTERDILRKAVAKKLDIAKAPVSKIMTGRLHTIGLDGTLIEVASIMKSHTMRRIVVLNKKGEAVGIVTSKDLVDILCT